MFLVYESRALSSACDAWEADTHRFLRTAVPKIVMTDVTNDRLTLVPSISLWVVLDYIIDGNPSIV
jgi:hypothetical protein